MDWGAKIRELRFLENLKQDALALQLGVSQSAVSQWERGVASPPDAVREILLERLQARPESKWRRALAHSVRWSPNLVHLLRLDGDALVLEAISEQPAYAAHPLLRREDVGQALAGRLGGCVEKRLRQLLDNDIFADEVLCARTRLCAERDGERIVGEVCYTPFVMNDERLIRVDIKDLDQEAADNDCDCAAPLRMISE